MDNISTNIIKNLNESYDEEDRIELNADELFNKFVDMEDDIEDFADRWNSCMGYPDDVRRQRIKIINPIVIEFVGDYYEDLKANWEAFEDIMEDNNYHTPLLAIEKEMAKYE